MGWKNIDRYLESKGIRFGAPTVGQTTGGKHAGTSFHYQGLARDYGVRTSDCRAVLAALLPFAKDGTLAELFYSPAGVFYKNGRAFKPSVALRLAHFSHVHAAIRFGRNLPLAQPVADHPTLLLGSKGIHVNYWQSLLVRVTGAAVPVDGNFGPSTKKATTNFQHFFKMSADGVVGPQSWGVMELCAKQKGVI